jgi:uncharacterized membrane protein
MTNPPPSDPDRPYAGASAVPRPAAGRSRLAGVLLGLGLGGFVDGILLHQIVHWHQMGSAVLRPDTIEAALLNMRWDGFFHAGVWALTVAGVFRLLHDARRGARLPTAAGLTGQLLLGWGLFNLVEGVVDHHLLGIHHVRDLPAHVPAYDWLFLGIGGLGLVVVGLLLSRVGDDRSAAAPA